MRTGFLFTNTIQKKYKISLCYSGGTDSNYMLQKICFSKKAYKYLFILYLFNDSDYNNKLQDILVLFNCYNISLFICFGNENYKLLRHISQSKYRLIKLNFILKTLKNNFIYKTIMCHNYNDNLENFFMKLNFNCSLKEIFMPFVKKITYFGHDVTIIRPMLNTTRTEIEKSASPIILDKDNINNRYLRTYIRKNIVNSYKNYSGFFKEIFRLTNIYNLNFYKNIYFCWDKKVLFFYKQTNNVFNLQLIKQASFLLVNNYSARFNIYNAYFCIANNKNFCVNSCLVRFINNRIEISRNRFHYPYVNYRYKNVHIYEITLYNFIRVEILSYEKIKLSVSNKYEIFIQVDNIIFNVSISKFFFINFFCIKNYYIIIILYISNYIN